MRIAVLSDTHDRVPAGLVERLRGAEEIWHLGDVCDPAVISEIETAGVPVRVVVGNCDEHFAWPVSLTLERGGVTFYLIHIPPSRVPAGVQVVLHGHTHVPRDEMIGSVRWLNPGCITRPRGDKPPSFAWLEVDGGKILGWKLVKV